MTTTHWIIAGIIAAIFIIADTIRALKAPRP